MVNNLKIKCEYNDKHINHHGTEVNFYLHYKKNLNYIKKKLYKTLRINLI